VFISTEKQKLGVVLYVIYKGHVVREGNMSASGRRVTSYVAQAEHAIDTFSHAGPFRTIIAPPEMIPERRHKKSMPRCGIAPSLRVALTPRGPSSTPP
jgi:hypothetical protein